MPWLRIIAEPDDNSLALKTIGQHGPKLILLDASLPDNQAWVLLRLTKQESPHIRFLVMANTMEQERLAKGRGADAVLLKGFAASELSLATRRLLLPQNGNSPVGQT